MKRGSSRKIVKTIRGLGRGSRGRRFFNVFL